MDFGTVPVAGSGVYVLDQLATNALASYIGADKQILKVAGVLDAPVGAVINALHHAHGLITLPGQCQGGGFYRVEKARPGRLGDVVRQLGFIEAQVGLPKR